MDTPIGNNAQWISAHALSCDAVLLTHDGREWGQIPTQPLEDWAA